MRILLDLLIIIIIAFCVWRGFKRGIVNAACAFLAVVIAIFGGNLVARAYSTEFTSILEPFMTGFVDKAMSSVLVWQDGDTETEKPEFILTDEQREDPKAIATAVYYQLGFTETIAEQLADETAETADGAMGQTLILDITDKICARISYLLVFYVAFALIGVIFAAVGNVLDLSFGMPGFENASHILGCIVGLLEGIAIVLAVSCAFRYIGVVVGREFISKTVLLKYLTENNLVAIILGI